MRIRKVPFLQQLTLLPRLFPVNCYLVELDDAVVLIDAALAYGAGAIAEAAAATGKPLTHLLLTHAHSDHVGALDRIKKSHPNIKVVVSARDARLLAGDVSLEPGEAQTPIRGGVPKRIQTKPDLLLHDGDRIGPLLAVSTPGHTPGSMSFLDERTGSLIVGDAFQTRGGLAVTGHMRPLFPFPALATWNKEEGIKSARRLLDLNPELLAVGHGEMLRRPSAAIKEAIASAERSLQAGGNSNGNGKEKGKGGAYHA